MTFLENISLLPYNTFNVNVQTRYFVEYDSVSTLQKTLKNEIFQQCRLLHIGGGSNLLFLNDFDGLVMHSRIKGIEIVKETEDEVTVRVGAGEVWDDFVIYAVDKNYGGIENLSVIPGEVGASAVQNIGAYGVEAKDVIQTVETVEISTGQIKIFQNEECHYSYRNSVFKNELKNQYIITHVTFRLQKKPVFCLHYGNLKDCLKDQPTLQKVRELVISIRNEKLPDPSVIGNAGSFFMNPVISSIEFNNLKAEYENIPGYVVSEQAVKVPAGWLIEQCGWKGKYVGDAGVYEKQALVLVNKGKATGQEIKELSDKIIRSVQQKFNINIHPEVNMIQ